MEKRPISVTVIAWFFIVGGAISLITTPASLSNTMVKELMAKSPLPLSIQYAMTYIGYLISIASGIGMLKRQNWARFLYVEGVAIVSLISLFTSPAKVMLIPSLIFCVIIIFFIFRPVANQYFSKR